MNIEEYELYKSLQMNHESNQLTNTRRNPYNHDIQKYMRLYIKSMSKIYNKKYEKIHANIYKKYKKNLNTIKHKTLENFNIKYPYCDEIYKYMQESNDNNTNSTEYIYHFKDHWRCTKYYIKELRNTIYHMNSQIYHIDSQNIKNTMYQISQTIY
jgi:hypothetical protein